MKLLVAILQILILSGLLISCGSTQIITDRYNDLDIYVDGVFKGNKNVYIARTGTPQRYLIQAKANGLTLGELDTRRSFTVGTLLLASVTDGIGILIGWRFPKTLIVPIGNQANNDDSNEPFVSPWEKQKEKSVWDKPLNH